MELSFLALPIEGELFLQCGLCKSAGHRKLHQDF